MLCNILMSKLGVQEGTKHTTLQCACVEDQRGGGVTNSQHLGFACQELGNLKLLQSIEINELRDEKRLLRE